MYLLADGTLPVLHKPAFSSVIGTLFNSLPPVQSARIIRFWFWALHEEDPALAQHLLREISVDWDQHYGWLGGTDTD